jgi:hypothetical protein
MIHFHRWSNWEPIVLTSSRIRGGREFKFTYDGQQRKCVKCGKSQREAIW